MAAQARSITLAATRAKCMTEVFGELWEEEQGTKSLSQNLLLQFCGSIAALY